MREAILFRACKNSEPLTDADVDARALFSSPDEKSLNGTGIGVTGAGVVVVVLGLLVTALPPNKAAAAGGGRASSSVGHDE
ncbi:MAG: hypothetical protein SPK00_06525 [Corynebacterium glucuronolyticum]|nr:hypothetical protein [Corynebacterium glucuronolyticum]MDD7586194.1 hypothetical protein [Mycobacteriaceae bacterium]MDY5834386.1 hypothetical protein [Corynebacterium glucuronolyticum]